MAKFVHGCISKVDFATRSFQRRRNKNKGPQSQQRPPEESCPEQPDSRERELAAATPAEEDSPQDPAPQKEPEPESPAKEQPQEKGTDQVATMPPKLPEKTKEEIVAEREAKKAEKAAKKAAAKGLV